MFNIELINLINEYKKTQDNYELNKIKKSISNLISQNKEEYQKFLGMQPLDEQTKQILKECENIANQIQNQNLQENFNSQDDFEIIKTYFSKWLQIFNQNGREVNQENKKIVNSIIEHYVTHRYEILEKIFELEEGEDFENFKWHIKNELRIYYINQIRKYRESQKYKNLNFIKKVQKDYRINLLIGELGKYRFDTKKIDEVLS